MASGVKPRRTGAAGRRSGGSFRTRVVLVLIGFVLVAMGVIARRTVGIGQATELRQLEVKRDGALGAKVKLESEIRDASSRVRLGPVAEKRLRMYVPSDSQVILLPRTRQ